MATLNDEELQALMSAIQDGQVDPSPEPSVRSASSVAVAVDLTNRDRIVRGEMPTLDAIHERAANLFGSGLAGRTRLDLRASSQPASLVRFADLHPDFSPPSAVCILGLVPSGDQGLAIFEGGFADALLAAALGDRKARLDGDDATRRGLTALDRRVLERLANVLCESLAEAWRDLMPFQCTALRFEDDPRLCMVAAPNDLAVTVAFEVTGQLTGTLRLAIPFKVLEPVRKQLSSPPRANASNDQRLARHLAAELERVDVELRALLGRASVHLERLLSLEVGDVIVLDTAETESLPVLVEGREKLRAEPLTSGSHIAVRIQQPPVSGAPEAQS